MIYIYPYVQGSKSAKLLAKELNGKLIKLTNSKYKWNKPTINWGNKTVHGACLNPNTKPATNKAQCLLLLEQAEVAHVPYTFDKEEALQWVKDGHVVFARVKVAAQGGAGIEILTQENQVDAPLYTRYVKKKVEYRVHVVRDKVIHVQEKKRKNGVEHNLIQSHGNGYIFAKITPPIPDEIEATSIAAVKACGLDFGAVDIIWNEHYKKAYVLEINTAPGLSLTTAVKYAQAFKEIFNV